MVETPDMKWIDSEGLDVQDQPSSTESSPNLRTNPETANLEIWLMNATLGVFARARAFKNKEKWKKRAGEALAGLQCTLAAVCAH